MLLARRHVGHIPCRVVAGSIAIGAAQNKRQFRSAVIVVRQRHARRHLDEAKLPLGTLPAESIQAEGISAWCWWSLEEIRTAARGSDNLLYPMKEALRARATVGEVSDALRDVWGQYVPRDAF